MKSILVLVLGLTPVFSYAKDLGFRYVDGICKNADGKEGLNPGYLGQCADLRNVTLLRFNLEDTDFSGADFTDADVQDSSFKNSVLAGVNFSGAHLSGVVFDGAKGNGTNFSRANLINAHLAGATFEAADFTEADFTNAQLSYLTFVDCRFVNTKFAGAAMDHIDLTGADLTNAQLAKVYLVEAILDRAILNAANLDSADLTAASMKQISGKGAILRNATLRRANMNQAKLIAANLRGANGEGADLSGASLKDSDLRGTNFKNTKVDGAEFLGSKYNRKSQFPFSDEKAADMGMVFIKASNLLIIWDYSEDGIPAPKSELDGLKKFLGEYGVEVEFSTEPHANFQGQDDLGDYKAILHLQGILYYREMPASGQETLLKFVKEGGTYIGTQWLSYAYDNGQLFKIRDLVLTEYDSNQYLDESYKVANGKQSHPMLAGIEDFSLQSSHTMGAIRSFDINPAVALMVNEQGVPRVVYREIEMGRVINFTFPVNFSGGPLLNPSVQGIFLNALTH